MEQDPDIFQTNIIDAFQSQGYSLKSLITKSELKLWFNRRSMKTFNKQFDGQIFEELWLQCQANSKGQILIKTMVQILCEANKILGNRINQLTEANGLIAKQTKKLLDKNKQLQELEQYDDNEDYKINTARRQIIEIKTKINEFEHDLNNFRKQHHILNNIFQQQQVIRHTTIIIPPKQSDYYQPKLLFIFHLTNVSLVLQFLISTYRLPFLPITVFLQIYYLLFIGYYQKNMVRNLLIQSVTSILFDITYLIFNSFTKLFILPERHTSQKYYFIVCLVFLVIQLVLRVILVRLLYPFLQRNRQNKQYFYFWDSKIYLNSRVKSQIENFDE